MSIRTRLLLFLLPTLIGSLALVFALYFLTGPLLILLSATLSTLFLVAMVFLVANKIVHPIQKLNNSALAIAAGQYGESIRVDGPKEIAELANTLNTMSECLHENINRLKENAQVKEQRYGEYECATLLEHLMLQKNIDDCVSDVAAIKAITFFSDTPRGLLLRFPKTESPSLFQVHLTEAQETGLSGMYQLLTHPEPSPLKQNTLTLTLDRNAMALQTSPSTDQPSPLFWSLSKNLLCPLSSLPMPTQPGDFFFLFNRGLMLFYKSPQTVEDLLTKVLQVFAEDGLETVVAMLHKELSFGIKRKTLEEDMHLLCFQILR